MTKKINRFLIGAVVAPIMTATSLSFTLQKEDPLAQSIENGKILYTSFCLQCHQSNGEGVPGVYPPLANNEHLSDKNVVIKTVTRGRPGGSTIKGVTYGAPMPPVQLKNPQVADVLNYIRNSWGNEAEYISPSEVHKVRNNNEQ